MRLQDYDTRNQFKAKVIATERITPVESPDEVRDLIIEVESGDFSVEVGQNIGVLSPGRMEFGQRWHFRLYSVADLPAKTSQGSTRLHICVRRCSYIDEFSGEEYRGVASNYLCDLRVDDTLTLTGPYGLAFEPPEESDASLILIGAGTGIAPFRAFIKHLYRKTPPFKGRVRLFHGGRTGLDLLYMNDKRNDFAQYYDEDTFEAISALSNRPHWSNAIDWGSVMESRGKELWGMLSDSQTYVYLAGLEVIRDELDVVFAKIAGSAEKWMRRKAEMEAGERWIELLY